LVLVLRSLVGKADAANTTAKYPWEKFNKFMVHMGQEEFDNETFKPVFDADPNIQKYVKRFDGEGIELKTKKEAPAQGPVDGNTGSDVVAQMAQRATNNAMAS
jgi:hypothetical protein